MKDENVVNNERILQEIEHLMEQRGISKYELSKRSGISQSTLSTMFSRRSTISTGNLVKISAAFDMSLSRFISIVEGNGENLANTDFPYVEWEVLPNKYKKAVYTMMVNLGEVDENFK